MIKNYIKTAWRNLVKSKVYSIVAIVGLAIGLSVSTILFWGINDDLTYDTQLPDAANIYRINARIKMGNDSYDTWSNVPAPISEAALRSLPPIQAAVRVKPVWQSMLITAGDRHLLQKDVAYTEPAYFSFFHIQFINGNARNALREMNNIVLSRDAAIKYFGSPNAAMGKTLLLGDKQTPGVVSAVIENMPQQSSTRKEMLLSMDVVRKNFGGNGNWKTIDEDWGNFSFTTFFRLKPGTNVAQLEKQLAAIHVKNNHYVKPGDVAFIFQPINTLRLYNPDLTPADIKVVQLFLVIGILIIVIAVVNYINLSTARVTKRAREVGMRRVVGANRKQLIVQFVTEFVLIFIAAVFLAILLLPLLIPFYKEISGKQYAIDIWQLSTLKIVGFVAVGTIVMASIYPAWVLSSFNPTEVLKSTFNQRPGGGLLRKCLVVLQFTVSVLLIICTISISKQMHYIQIKNLGYNRQNVFMINMNAAMGHQIQTVMNELETDKNVKAVTYSTDNLMSMGSSTDNINWAGKTNSEAHISPMQIAANFTKVMQMQFVAGSGFTGSPADSAYYLINESAVKLMNLKDPIGAVISLWGHPGQVKGVLKDFNNTSLKKTIQPTIFSAARSADWGGVLYVKTNPTGIREAIEKAGKLYHTINPLQPYEYQFMDDNFDAMYSRELKTATLFKAFAGVAILLSCLGLFGLAVFTAERRTKEIGIRKVLGASVQSISLLISREFSMLVLVANIIAWPLAWYFSKQWMQDFAYRTDISWWVFAAAALASFILALGTVSSQAIRAALASPVKSLKVE